MEEILHHLGCLKPCNIGNKLLTTYQWCRISSINGSIPFSKHCLSQEQALQGKTHHTLEFADSQDAGSSQEEEDDDDDASACKWLAICAGVQNPIISYYFQK